MLLVGNKSKYPFNRMEVGDYLKLTFKSPEETDRARKSIYSYAYMHKMKFKSSRKGNTLEVWRKE
jgi:hypothetical protein